MFLEEKYRIFSQFIRTHTERHIIVHKIQLLVFINVLVLNISYVLNYK